MIDQNTDNNLLAFGHKRVAADNVAGIIVRRQVRARRPVVLRWREDRPASYSTWETAVD